MPELEPAHERLAALAGTWNGTERLAPSPWSPGGEARGELRISVAAGGFAIVQEYRSDTGLTGHGVFSAQGDEVLWHWFDSIGYPPEMPARGGWQDDVLSLVRTTPRGTNRTTFVLVEDRLEQRIEVDGSVLVEATYERQLRW